MVLVIEHRHRLLISALIYECKLNQCFNNLVSRDINMNKWNCELRKRVNRKEFRDFMAD
eukprot:Pgem_evm1s5903